MILDVPADTLEIVDADHEWVVDVLEAGPSFDKRVRIAVLIDDLGRAAREVSDPEERRYRPPVDTPWGDRNQRFTTPEGLQLTPNTSSSCRTPGSLGAGGDPFDNSS